MRTIQGRLHRRGRRAGSDRRGCAHTDRRSGTSRREVPEAIVALMPTSSVIVVVMIAALCLAAVVSGSRAWRAVVFLALVSGALVAAGWLPLGASPWARALMWGGAVLVLLFRGDLLSAMPRAEYQFVVQFLAARQRLSRLKGRALTTPPAEYVGDYSKIIHDFEELAAPAGDWASLRSDTVGELKRRLAMMRLSTTVPETALEAADLEWANIERRLDSLLSNRARFWAK